MATSSGYAWSLRLQQAVADGGTITVPTPGFEASGNYDTDNAAVVVDGDVMTQDQASCVWAGDSTSVDVTNDSGSDWQAAQTVYVTVRRVPFDPADIQASFDALEQRVTENEAEIADLEARVSVLEGAGTSQLALRKEHHEGQETPKQGSTKAKSNKPHIKSSPKKRRW